MKKITIKIILFLIITANIFGCSSLHQMDEVISSVLSTVSKVSLNRASIHLKPGEETQITASVFPLGVSQEVIWASSDEMIARVSDAGKVKALKSGVAVITASSLYSKDKKASVTLTIIGTGIPNQQILPQSIVLDKEQLQMVLGDEEKLSLKVLPDTASQEIIFQSNDTDIINISTNNVLKAVGAGWAKVTVLSKANKEIKTSFLVNVSKPLVEKVEIEDPDQSLGLNQIVFLSTRVFPEKAEQSIIWQSSDEEVAIVSDDGALIVRGPGYAVISAISAAFSNKLDKINVLVKNDTLLENLEVYPNDLVMTVQENTILKPIVYPLNANQAVEWKSLNEQIVVVENGIVTALAPGITEIEVISQTFSNKRAKVKIEVKPAVEEVILDQEDFSLFTSVSKEIKANILPAGAPQTLIWSSSDSAIASVKKGIVKALTPGEVTITAASENNPEKFKSIKVKIIASIDYISLDKRFLNIRTGDTTGLSATVYPLGASQSIKWLSSDDNIATVSDTGLVIAVASGKTIITARSLVDDSKKAEAIINVTRPDPPQIISIPETQININQQYLYNIQAQDENYTSLTYTVIAKPSWLTFNKAKGLLSGIPSLSDAGRNLVKITVSNGQSSVEQAFFIDVNVPVSSIVGKWEAYEGDFISHLDIEGVPTDVKLVCYEFYGNGTVDLVFDHRNGFTGGGWVRNAPERTTWELSAGNVIRIKDNKTENWLSFTIYELSQEYLTLRSWRFKRV
ncbi:Ig domain-containing protein [Candidatus Margulisiibacteriota bacterium]